MARVDDEALYCLAGCPDLALGASTRTGWEMALRGQLPDGYDALWGDPWGLAPMHTVAWDRYSDPESRLQRRWGTPGDEGNEVRSVEGAALVRQHLDDTARIAEMSAALRMLGAAVRADPEIRLRGGNREAVSFQHALGAAHTVQARMLDVATADVARDAIAAVWADGVMRGWLIREVGVAAAIELHRSIVLRGGSFGGVAELLRQLSGVRDTPFGGYRHAVAFWCGDHSTLTLGAGNGLASMQGADMPAALPGGMRFDEIAVNPSRNRSHDPRHVGAWVMKQDVVACFAAARVGGVWVPPQADEPGAVGDAWHCDGGRPLAPWELRLVELCDYGVDMAQRDKKGRRLAAKGSAKGDDLWRPLAVVEAVEQVRREAVARAQDGAAGAAWGQARHITTNEGKAALKAARRALREALAAWGLTRRPEPRPAGQRRTDEPPRDRPPVPRWERAANAWDPEAPR